MLKSLELSEADHEVIVEHCRAREFCSCRLRSMRDSATLLNSLGMTIFKVPSGELTNLPLLRQIAV
jgi:N-acetylneuraminate synthase/N,N'-diacetyllegionaminate synthase